MPFERFVKKQNSKGYPTHPYISVLKKSKGLYVSTGLVRLMDGATRVNLFYDRDTGSVGLQVDEHGDYLLVNGSELNRYRTINCKRFIEVFELASETMYQARYDAESGMIICEALGVGG